MDAPEPAPGSELAAQRPQTLMLTVLGEYLLGRSLCVYSGSVIDVLARVGVSEQATRSTLTRMVNHGLLRRQRHGQRMYFGLTDRTSQVLADGRHRLRHAGAVNRDWDGTWTLLSFSCPAPGNANATTCAPSSAGPASARCKAACGSPPALRTWTTSSPTSACRPTSACSTPAPTTSPPSAR
jgi:hypothetical protein